MVGLSHRSVSFAKGGGGSVVRAGRTVTHSSGPLRAACVGGNPDMARIGAMAAAKKEAADKFAASVLPAIDGIMVRGITSQRGIAAELDRMKIKSATGKNWSGAAVALGLAGRG